MDGQEILLQGPKGHIISWTLACASPPRELLEGRQGAFLPPGQQGCPLAGSLEDLGLIEGEMEKKTGGHFESGWGTISVP